MPYAVLREGGCENTAGFTEDKLAQCPKLTHAGILEAQLIVVIIISFYGIIRFDSG